MSNDTTDTCICREVRVGGYASGLLGWNPDCPVHEGLHHDHIYKGYQRGCKKCKAEKETKQ